jgi:hypothetical protein
MFFTLSAKFWRCFQTCASPLRIMRPGRLPRLSKEPFRDLSQGYRARHNIKSSFLKGKGRKQRRRACVRQVLCFLRWQTRACPRPSTALQFRSVARGSLLPPFGFFILKQHDTRVCLASEASRAAQRKRKRPKKPSEAAAVSDRRQGSKKDDGDDSILLSLCIAHARSTKQAGCTGAAAQPSKAQSREPGESQSSFVLEASFGLGPLSSVLAHSLHVLRQRRSASRAGGRRGGRGGWAVAMAH